jgi:hypothetical protein
LFIANPKRRWTATSPTKPDNFVDDPEKLYRLRRREAQAKKLEFADPKAESEGSSESPKKSSP